MSEPRPTRTLKSRELNAGEFRVDSLPEILALLDELVRARTRVLVSGPEGLSLQTRLWSVDAPHEVLSLEVGADRATLNALLASGELTAIAYLDNIRLQFDLDGLVLVSDAQDATLRAQLPTRLYRFQRRQAFRVQPTSTLYPQVNLRHPAIADMQLRLRVLDVSAGGLALLLPPDVPPIEPGLELAGVVVELDRDTRFEVKLRLQHSLPNATTQAPGGASPHAAQSAGVQIGCKFVELSPMAARALHVYIDQTQKRRRLMSKR